MKKLIAVVLVVVFALAFAAGCSSDDGVKTYKVGVAIYKYDDNFMTLYREEIIAYFKTLETEDVKYDVIMVDSRGDMATQTEQVDSFIAQKVDVMIINLVQSTSANIITEKAKAANIPVVYINREPSTEDMNAWDRITYVGADARQSGTIQGEIIANLPSRGDADGDGVVRYVMIMGDPENVDAQYRTEFSIKALTDAGIEVENLFQQRGDWEQSKGQELAATALAQFGAAIDVIFCNNDGMAMGAMQAISTAGRTVGQDIYLVGVDAIPEAMDAVRDGLMTGTVLNDHIGQSHAAVDAAVRFIKGETVNKFYIIDYKAVS